MLGRKRQSEGILGPGNKKNDTTLVRTMFSQFPSNSSNLVDNLTENNGAGDIQFSLLKIAINKRVKEEADKRNIITPTIAGALLLQEMIVEKLKTISTSTPEKIKKYEKRVAWFQSTQFISNFLDALSASVPSLNPDPDSPMGRKIPSYTRYLHKFFGINGAIFGYKDEETLRRVYGFRSTFTHQTTDTEQCKTAIGPSEDAPGCYICQNPFKLNDKIDCEHILGVVDALAHLWIVQDKNFWDQLSPEEQAFLSNEYNWAHFCCNVKKTNKSMIRLNADKSGYEVDTDTIKEILRSIHNDTCHENTDGSYGRTQYCKGINCAILPEDDDVDGWDENPSYGVLVGCAEKIVAIVNENIQKYGKEYYPFFIRLRVLAAIGNRDFDVFVSGNKGGSKRFHKTKKDRRTKKTHKKQNRSADTYYKKFINWFLTNEDITQEIIDDMNQYFDTTILSTTKDRVEEKQELKEDQNQNQKQEDQNQKQEDLEEEDQIQKHLEEEDQNQKQEDLEEHQNQNQKHLEEDQNQNKKIYVSKHDYRNTKRRVGIPMNYTKKRSQ
jgi:hypothetical protein